MKYYGLDLETVDPYLKTRGKVKERGSSVVFGCGKVIVTGIYNAQSKSKKAYEGDGGDNIRKLYTDPDAVIVGANIPYDIVWDLFSLGLKPEDLACNFIDVQIVESLIDEYQPFSLDDLAVKYLNEHKGKEELEVIAAGEGFGGDFRQHLGELWDLGYHSEIKDYVISDADQPVRIWFKQKEILEQQGLMPAFVMNMKMIKSVVAMKYYGVNFDFHKWLENCSIAENAYELLKKDYEGKYGAVNINSPKQLAVQLDRYDVPYKMKICVKGWKQEGRKFSNKTDLFEGVELYRQKKQLAMVFQGITLEKKRIVLYINKRYADRTVKQMSDMGYEVTSNPSINKNLFAELSGSHKIVEDLATYKQAKNLIDKFLSPAFGRFIVVHIGDKRYPAFDDKLERTTWSYDKKATFRIHGSFNIVGARQTGRLSGKTPNLQQVSSKTVLWAGTDREVNLARMCRECFIAEKGGFFLKQDYAAQENRLAAHFAPGRNGDKIRKMYNENPDLDEHQYVVDISGLAEEFGAKTGRKYAKNLRFGVSYGMGIPRMMKSFGWAKDFAESLYDKVSSAAPWLFDLMDKVQDVVLKRRFIRTIMGRRIHLRSKHDNEAYAFMNYLIQGSASDMTKNATNRVTETKTCELMVLTVHDEDDFSLPCTKAGIERALKIGEIMETSTDVSVPMLSEPEVGTSWADGVEYDKAYGTRREFITAAVTAIKEGKWEQFRRNAKEYLKKDDDNMTFSEFCYSMEEDEDEAEEA